MATMPHTHGVAPSYEGDTGDAFWLGFIFILGIFVFLTAWGFALACAGVAWLQPLSAFYRAFNLDVPVPFLVELLFAVPLVIAALWLGIRGYRLYQRIRIWLYYLSFSLGF